MAKPDDIPEPVWRKLPAPIRKAILESDRKRAAALKRVQAELKRLRARVQRRPAVKYGGVLMRPIALSSLDPRLLRLAAPTENDKRKTAEAYLRAYEERVDALYTHYGIDRTIPGADFALAMALARDHVPGFAIVAQPPRGRGKPTRDPSGEFAELPLCFDALMLKARGKTIDNACQILARRDPYRGIKWTTLKARFYRAIKHRHIMHIATSAVAYEREVAGRDINPSE